MRPKRIAIIGADFPTYELYCPNWVGMKAGLAALGIEHHLFTCRPTLDIDAVVDYAPDLVIYGLIDLVRRPGCRQELRARLPAAKIVLWYGDYRESWHQIRADISELDMMFVSNDEQGAWYEANWKARKCAYLPLGSPIYHETPDPKLSFDFVFIGAVIASPGFAIRARYMTEYRRAHGLKIINGPSHRPDLREKVFRAMPRIYRSSTICLDQSHFTKPNRYTSNRHWIITASGGFALTKRFPGCEIDYPEGTRAYFDNFEQSVELLEYYRTHPAEREKIRLAGYKHAENHTYEHRFLRMFEMLYS